LIIEIGSGKKLPHMPRRKTLGVTRVAVIGIVAIVVVSSVVAAYIALQQSTPSHTPTITQTPTSTPTPGSTPSSVPTPTQTPALTPSSLIKTHMVDYTTMIDPGPGTDCWNLTVSSPYVVILNDSMIVSSGDQYLIVEGESYNGNIGVIWQVWFLNATYYRYVTDVYGRTPNSGYAYCSNGLVQVSVSSAAITFTGTTSISFDAPFENLDFVLTRNGDGSFNGGKLSINIQ
jgi:hypothetical protein